LRKHYNWKFFLKTDWKICTK